MDKYSHSMIDVTAGLVPLKENKECRGTQINGNWGGKCVHTFLTGRGILTGNIEIQTSALAVSTVTEEKNFPV